MPKIVYTTRQDGARLKRLIRARISGGEWLINLAAPVHDAAGRKWRHEAYLYDTLADTLIDTGRTAEVGYLAGKLERSKIIKSDSFRIFVTDHRLEEEAQHA